MEHKRKYFRLFLTEGNHEFHIWPIVGLVLFVAFLVKAFTIFDRPAWDDELWTMRLVYGGNTLNVVLNCIRDYWPPLHYVMLNWIAQFLDTSMQSMRLPSLLFGAGTAGLIVVVAYQWLKSIRAAVLAGLLLIFAVSHLVYSQEARVYSMQVFLAILSSYYFLGILVDNKRLWPHILVTVLLVYSHLYSWYFIAAQWAFIGLGPTLSIPTSRLRAAVKSQALILAFALPLYLGFAWAYFADHTAGPVLAASTGLQKPTIYDAGMMYASLLVRGISDTLLYGLLFVLSTVAVVTKWVQGTRGPTGQFEDARTVQRIIPSYLLCWIAVPALLSYLVTITTPIKSFGPSRYHLFILPALIFYAVIGVRLWKNAMVYTIVVCWCIVIGFVNISKYYRSFDHAHFDEAAAFVRAHRQANEKILVGNGLRAFNYYYRNEFPRIGSKRWNAISAETAPLATRSIDLSGKHASTYTSERIPEFIYPRKDFDSLLVSQSVDSSFWLILYNPSELGILDTVTSVYKYQVADSVSFLNVVVAHCRQGG
jgi:hypothetical protein